MRPLVEQQHIDEIRKLMNERDESIRSGDDRRAKQACEKALHRYEILIKGITIPDKRRQYEEAAEELREDIRKLEYRLKHPEKRAQNATVSKKKELYAAGDDETNTAENLLLVKTPNVKFSDIAGLDDVKEKFIGAIIYPRKHAEDYDYYRVRPGAGILLYGPPGCGKTMLAEAAAAECGAAFINVKISDIKNKYVGESEKRIREVFELARQHDQAIIFFDEIDALAGERSDSQAGHERSLLNELLIQMDGLESKQSDSSILILGATNTPWNVDMALRRDKRLGTVIFIPHPDRRARKHMLTNEMKDRPCDVDTDLLADWTDGFIGAEIADICNEAAKIPLMEKITKTQHRRKIGMQDFKTVIDGKKSVLRGWYPMAIKQVLKRKEDTEMFSELIEAGKIYLDSTK